jgi:hypothetical protein
MLEHDPNRQVLHVQTEHPCWLVRVSQDFPGWVAYVNGEQAQIRPYLGVLPAVHVQAGASTVEWRYEPQILKLGATISIGTAVLLALLCAVSFVKTRRSRHQESNIDAGSSRVSRQEIDCALEAKLSPPTRGRQGSFSGGNDRTALCSMFPC